MPALRVDEHKAVAETAVHEHRDRRQIVALVDGDEIGADVLLADVEFVLAGEPPVPLARAHVGEEDELDAVGLDQPFLERARDVVIAAGDGEFQLRHLFSPRIALSPLIPAQTGIQGCILRALDLWLLDPRFRGDERRRPTKLSSWLASPRQWKDRRAAPRRIARARPRATQDPPLRRCAPAPDRARADRPSRRRRRCARSRKPASAPGYARRPWP